MNPKLKEKRGNQSEDTRAARVEEGVGIAEKLDLPEKPVPFFGRQTLASRAPCPRRSWWCRTMQLCYRRLKQASARGECKFNTTIKTNVKTLLEEMHTRTSVGTASGAVVWSAAVGAIFSWSNMKSRIHNFSFGFSSSETKKLEKNLRHLRRRFHISWCGDVQWLQTNRLVHDHVNYLHVHVWPSLGGITHCRSQPTNIWTEGIQVGCRRHSRRLRKWAGQAQQWRASRGWQRWAGRFRRCYQ